MFQSAKPIWAKGMAEEINLFLAFTFALPAGDIRLDITASAAYHLYVNGAFVEYGPARAGDGHFRVSRIEIGDRLILPENEVRVLVAGYNLSCFEYTLHPSFLTLEAVRGARILFATGRDAVCCRQHRRKLRFTEKYSNQRVFTEAFDLSAGDGEPLAVETLPPPVYLSRATPVCRNIRLDPEPAYEEGDVARGETALPVGYRQFTPLLNPGVAAFETLDLHLYREVDMLRCANPAPPEASDGPLPQGRYRCYKIRRNSTGLIALSFTATEAAELYFVFDELLMDGRILVKRSNCVNAIKINAPAGAHEVLTFEPYTLQYGKLCVLRGEVRDVSLSLVEIAYPPIDAPELEDGELNLILESAVETFRQNATDIYMDCPSRERAGWLCDSFFTARSEWALTGGAAVEHSFLENFVRTTGFRLDPPMPDGMFPMCYPASHDYIGGLKVNRRNYIPNWAMWLVLELDEYARARNGDAALVERFREPVGRLLRYFASCENSDGLIEDLPGWVFLEWSRANDPDVVCGVNYPTNMLYGMMLDAAARLYGDGALAVKAGAIRDTIRRQAFDGRFFVDNAVRRDGALRQTGNKTEACQYYAFFTGTATPASHPALFDTLMRDFGPDRKQTALHPDVAFANAFVGNYLRMEILRAEKRYEQMIREIRGYFLGMARRTGTLWEHDQEKASCNHGFASYVACLLLEAADRKG